MVPFHSGSLPPDRLRAILGNAIMRQVALGWRIESQLDNQAVMASGGEVNHAAHLLISLFTCGAWLPVWIILGVTGGEKRVVISVDPHGVLLFNGRPAPMVAGPPRRGPVIRPRGDANAQAIAAANMRRELRRQAREHAAKDLALARELRIGRPDLPREYDDGGLVDLNSAPAPVIADLCGLEPAQAGRIVQARQAAGRFASVEDVFSWTELPVDTWDRLRDRSVTL
jgi:DNA uptake protein ComE-like DNA-binding protein